MLIISAHAADFVWRAGGAAALYAAAGAQVTVACLSYGERGESARLWRQGKGLGEIKEIRRQEAEDVAKVLGAQLRTFDAGDYPLVETPELLYGLVALYRETQPTVVLTHPERDPCAEIAALIFPIRGKLVIRRLTQIKCQNLRQSAQSAEQPVWERGLSRIQ